MRRQKNQTPNKRLGNNPRKGRNVKRGRKVQRKRKWKTHKKNIKGQENTHSSHKGRI